MRDRYQAFLKHWPVPNDQVRVPTSQGETFVVVWGAEDAPALLLLHGGTANSAMLMAGARFCHPAEWVNRLAGAVAAVTRIVFPCVHDIMLNGFARSRAAMAGQPTRWGVT